MPFLRCRGACYPDTLHSFLKLGLHPLKSRVLSEIHITVLTLGRSNEGSSLYLMLGRSQRPERQHCRSVPPVSFQVTSGGSTHTLMQGGSSLESSVLLRLCLNKCPDVNFLAPLPSWAETRPASSGLDLPYPSTRSPVRDR